MKQTGPSRSNRDFQQNPSASLYSRNGAMDATYIPGVHGNDPEMKNIPEENKRKSTQNEDPVVGFLYSISRKGIGEYWPLHLGANTIGRSADCDIQLKEMTVSNNHAVISVRKMKTNSEVIAMVRDNGSKTGMYLNETELDFENHSCKNGDVLTIGLNYKLLVILINTQVFGLSVAEDFEPIYEEDEFDDSDKYMDLDQTVRGNTPRSNYMDDGTIDLNGNDNPFASGNTQFM